MSQASGPHRVPARRPEVSTGTRCNLPKGGTVTRAGGSSCADSRVRVALGARQSGSCGDRDGRPAMAPHEIIPAVPGRGVSVRRHGGFTIVSITGGLDAGTVPVLRERVHDLLLPHESQIVIDLSEAPHCDQSGLAMLIGVGRRASMLGGTMRLVAPPPLVAEALCRTGLRSRFTIFASLPEALSAPPALRLGSGPAPAPLPADMHAVALSWRTSAPRRSHEGAPVVRRSVSEMAATMVAPSTTRPSESWRRLLVSTAC